MKPVFADTSYYVALFSPGDAFHKKAANLSRTIKRPVVVTDFVLMELANALSHADARHIFVELLPHLRSDPNALIVSASRDLFDAGYRLYAQRPDKNWSLTDCISFHVMRQHDLTDALTADRHFGQAGFNVLLR